MVQLVEDLLLEIQEDRYEYANLKVNKNCLEYLTCFKSAFCVEFTRGLVFSSLLVGCQFFFKIYFFNVGHQMTLFVARENPLF